MLNRNIILGGIAIAFFQSINPVYSMEYNYNIKNLKTNQTLPVTITPEQPWDSVIKNLENAFGAGYLIFAGKKVAATDVIPSNIHKENLGGLVYRPVLDSSTTIEQQALQLMGSHLENDITRGGILMAFSQIKSAIEQNDWETARRRFNRMEDTAKSDLIAQALKFDIDRH